MSRRLRIAITVASGLAWGLCFRRHAEGVLPWVALVPWFVVMLDVESRRRGQFLLGWAHGTVSWLVSVYWISPVMVVHGGLPLLAGPFLLFLLAAYLGIYHALFALGLSMALPRLRERAGRSDSEGAAGPSAPRLVLFSMGLWAALELIRGWLFTGFPWNLAGYSIERVPGALEAAAWIGARGLGMLVVGMNGALALALIRRRWRAPVTVGIVIVVVLLGGALLPNGITEDGAPVAVRIVQPNIPIQVSYDPRVALENYSGLIELARGLCTAERPLIVLPESALWPYEWSEPRVRADLERIASPDCAVVFNTAIWTDDETVYNSAAMVGPDGLLGRYDKNQLVPWGEYVPLGNVIPFIRRIARAAGDFTAADEVTLLQWEGLRLGVSICFEVIFPEQVARRVTEGASILLTMTNDAWYGDTSAPWQHLRAARFRAAETGRPLLRAAITGVSAAYDARARSLGSLGVGERGVLAIRIQPTRGQTPWVRAPWLIPTLGVAGALLALFAIGFPSRDSVPSPARPLPDPSSGSRSREAPKKDKEKPGDLS